MVTSRSVVGFFVVLITLCALHGLAHAQFWSALPTANPHAIYPSISFSQDEKWVFYLSGGPGKVDNISRVSIKGGAPIAVTKFTDASVVRAFHSLSSRIVLYMKGKSENDTEFHIYTIKDDGTGDPFDVTPTGPGVQNTIIGQSYNGRYVYYTANKESPNRLDCYRYDVGQNISELIFPNDKDYKVLAWSRDQDKLLVEDPATERLSLYNIETTQFQQLATPPTGSHFIEALLSTDAHKLGVLESTGGSIEEKWTDVGSANWTSEMSKAFHIDFSANGKYKITSTNDGVTVTDVPTKEAIPLPSDAVFVAISPKENLILYIEMNKSTLELYDVAKKTTTDLYKGS